MQNQETYHAPDGRVANADAIVTDFSVFAAMLDDADLSTGDLAVAFDPRWLPGSADVAEPGQSQLALVERLLGGARPGPLRTDDPLLSPAIALIAALRRGELSHSALLSATRLRIEQVDRDLHAHVAVLDDAMAGGDAGGLLDGLPVAVKDIFDVRGLPTRCNSPSRDGAFPAAVDAVSVRMLRQAGATIVSKTVTQEFAAGVVSAPARNPWDSARIPGGSSGGSAAAVATGAATLAFGSDTGGSVRIPAAACGVTGLKPTFGRISRRGVYPLGWTLDTVGPIARSVQDAALMFLCMDGYDPADPASRPTPVNAASGWDAIFGDPSALVMLNGVRLGYSPVFFLDAVQPEIAAAFESALAVLRSLGAEIVETPWPGAGLARAAAMVANRIETAGVHEATVAANPNGYGAELRERIAIAGQLSGVAYLRSQQARLRAKREIATICSDHRLDGFLSPTLPSTAVPADDLNVRYPNDVVEPVGYAFTRLTQPFNATGQPALSIPCGFDGAGLPASLQIAGAPDDEATICLIGHAFQCATDWHERVPAVLQQDR